MEDSRGETAEMRARPPALTLKTWGGDSAWHGIAWTRDKTRLLPGLSAAGEDRAGQGQGTGKAWSSYLLRAPKSGPKWFLFFFALPALISGAAVPLKKASLLSRLSNLTPCVVMARKNNHRLPREPMAGDFGGRFLAVWRPFGVLQRAREPRPLHPPTAHYCIVRCCTALYSTYTYI